MLVETQPASPAASWRKASPGPLDPGRPIAAVLFDVDGTLYDQKRLRRLMAAELATLPVWRPLTAMRILRGLQAFRHAQEELRAQQSAPGQQLQLAAGRAGLEPEELEQIVDEWMQERPLKHLRTCLAPGLHDLVAFLAASGVELGVLSDYPVDSKLQALGLSEVFPLRLCASDPEVNAFKPHPRGFLVAASRWGLPPSTILVVGDRVDVDAAGARAAGMRSVIVGRADRGLHGADDVTFVPTLEGLHSVLDGRR
jgi:HAD superfamily hydrolase (TIGR01549 family)